MSRFGRVALLLITLVGLLAGVGAHHAIAVAVADKGTFTLAAEVPVNYPPTNCPAGTPPSVECFARKGIANIRGLGEVTETYPYSVDGAPAGCGVDEVRVLPATVRLSVTGKGEIEIRLSGSGCLVRIPPAPVRGEETFTVTGASGKYVGASGAGTLVHESSGPFDWNGRDTWTGTLVVPGLEFDLTAPVLRGARNKKVRVSRAKKRVRVRFAVSAQDDVDGARPVACRPRSGSWFRVGRTRVQCSAADTSSNESAATFTVTVKRR